MLLPAIIWVIVFNYIPMGGITVAFKSFNYMKGIFWKSVVWITELQIHVYDQYNLENNF